MANEKKSSNTCLYVGLGCGGVLLLGILVVAGFTFWGVQKAKEFGEDMKDPAKREAKVLEVLGADQLPEGYHGIVSFSVPFVMDFAIISDREPDDSGDVDLRSGDSTFIYMNLLSLGEKQELRDFFEGRNDDPAVLRDNNVNLDIEEVIRRGTVELTSGQDVLYLTGRGELQSGGRGSDGITTVMLIECGDNRMRMGIWGGPDNDSETPIESADFTGTPADEAEMTAFMDHFKLCA